jgi:hypothetical protein
MAKLDIEKIRESAKSKALAVKQKTADLRALKKNPPPQYVDLPELTGDPEKDSHADLTAVQEGFRKRAKDEGRRFELATDTEYFACLCFQTREQKEIFLKAMNLLQFGDKYLDGQKVAKELGVDLPPADVPYNVSSKIDPVWAGFVD